MAIADTVPSAQTLIYDPNGQWCRKGYRAHVPDKPQSLEEFEEYVQEVVLRAQPRLFIVDEAHLILPRTLRRLPEGLMELRARGRHYGIAVLYIAHRPVDVSSDLRELLDYIFLFHIPGGIDTRYLNQLRSGLGDATMELEPYHFVVYSANTGDWYIHKPVKDHELG